jgi:hypothetical protein
MWQVKRRYFSQRLTTEPTQIWVDIAEFQFNYALKSTISKRNDWFRFTSPMQITPTMCSETSKICELAMGLIPEKICLFFAPILFVTKNKTTLQNFFFEKTLFENFNKSGLYCFFLLYFPIKRKKKGREETVFQFFLWGKLKSADALDLGFEAPRIKIWRIKVCIFFEIKYAIFVWKFGHVLLKKKFNFFLLKI